jgi:uroporphyrinogen decarboxylase
MDGYELAWRAITFAGPERIPLRYLLVPERSDVVVLDYAADWENLGAGLKRDEWGCVWEQGPAGIDDTMGQVREYPLTDWANWPGYQAPALNEAQRFAAARERMAGLVGRYLVGSLGISGFTRLTFLRGFAETLTDLYLSPDKLAAMAEMIFAWERAVIAGWKRAGAHAVMFYDDWGSQKGLLIRPEMWREVFRPLYRRHFAYCHDLGLPVFFHSCGQVYDIVGELIDAGADVLNLNQSALVGVDRLARYAGKVCFFGPLDLQLVLADPSRSVEAEVHHLLRCLARPSGGYMAYADMGPTKLRIPDARIRAMGEAFKVVGDRLYQTGRLEA